MKKTFLLFVAMMAFMSSSVIYADDIVLAIKTGEGPAHPRTGVPITASIDNGMALSQLMLHPTRALLL